MEKYRLLQQNHKILYRTKKRMNIIFYFSKNNRTEQNITVTSFSFPGVKYLLNSKPHSVSEFFTVQSIRSAMRRSPIRAIFSATDTTN